MTTTQDKLVWIDMEMTGLQVFDDHIMEIAVVITDYDLNLVAQMPTSLAVHLTDAQLAKMNDWCVEHHGKSGLTQRCRDSTLTIQQVEQQVLNFVKLHVAAQSAPIAGNSVYMDRFFMKREMPLLDAYLHYRIVDVSSIKELQRHWYTPKQVAPFVKKGTHQALDDILESIAELKHYKQFVFK